MIVWLRWLVPAAFLAIGLYLLQQSYRSFAQWNESLRLGDFSEAEFFEVNFWLSMPPSILMLMLSGFLAGRWSVRVPKAKQPQSNRTVAQGHQVQ